VEERAFDKKWGVTEVGAQTAWNPPNGVASRQIAGAFASVIFPCTVKSRWQAIVEEVDTGCREFCSRYCNQDCRHTDP